MPETSFLVPVRNGAPTLGDALRSVLAQTQADLEVVVVDDGSTDGSAEVAAGLHDPRIRVLRRPARGLVAALNAGLAACRGRFVARMDADDLAAPHRLDRQLPLLRGDPGLAVVDGQVTFFREDGAVPPGMRAYEAWINGILEPDDFRAAMATESPVVHPAATIRADVLREVGGYRHGPFPEDHDLWARIAAAGHTFRKVPEVLVRMRDHGARLTRTDPRYGRDGFRAVRQRWLAATHFRTPRRVAIVGGGREARAWARWVRAEGHTLVAVVDVAPRRIGGTLAGAPVVADLAPLDVEVALVVVGSRDARARVAAFMASARPEWREGRDWWRVVR